MRFFPFFCTSSMGLSYTIYGNRMLTLHAHPWEPHTSTTIRRIEASTIGNSFFSFFFFSFFYASFIGTVCQRRTLIHGNPIRLSPWDGFEDSKTTLFLGNFPISFVTTSLWALWLLFLGHKKVLLALPCLWALSLLLRVIHGPFVHHRWEARINPARSFMGTSYIYLMR